MTQQTSSQVNPPAFINAVHGCRYQVKDVARAVAFYTQHLGFTLKHQQLPAFANVSLGDADVLLNVFFRRGRTSRTDSEAHTTAQLAYAKTASAHARLTGIPADRIVNCWPPERLLAWLRDPSSECRH